MRYIVLCTNICTYICNIHLLILLPPKSFVLDPTVRDSSAEALGTAMKLIGEKSMMPFLTDIDNLKMTKVFKAQNC